jgi:hypothetical protein
MICVTRELDTPYSPITSHHIDSCIYSLNSLKVLLSFHSRLGPEHMGVEHVTEETQTPMDDLLDGVEESARVQVRRVCGGQSSHLSR